MFKLPLILLPILLIGCGNVQNIRTTDPTAEKAESGKLIFMTFNIRAAGGMQNPVSNPDLVEETKGRLTKIAAAINSVDPNNFKVLAAGPISIEHGDVSGHKAYWATIKPKD